MGLFLVLIIVSWLYAVWINSFTEGFWYWFVWCCRLS
jgi:hypothetical protein